MDYEKQITYLEEKLKGPLPGAAAQRKMASKVRGISMDIPPDAKESAVLGLLFPKQNDLNLLLIKRTEDGRPHSGQIGFPGGRREEADDNLLVTALRETHEEVGIPSSSVTVLGALSSLYIPVSKSNVFPYIGFTAQQPEYVLSADEVQYVLEVPIKELFDPAIKSVKSITPSAFPNITLTTPVYEWQPEHIIWGATAMMIAELEELLL